MKYADIKKYDIANGPGVRMSLFVSGCDHHCKNCFNPETWDYDYGKEFTMDTINEIVELLKPSHITGLTLLGGDPLMPRNIHDVALLCRIVKETYPEKSIWCYTGYTWEFLMSSPVPDDLYKLLTKYIDVLVDGPFIEELKNLSLKFRGSSNQRIIDMHKTLREYRIGNKDKVITLY